MWEKTKQSKKNTGLSQIQTPNLSDFDITINEVY